MLRTLLIVSMLSFLAAFPNHVYGVEIASDDSLAMNECTLNELESMIASGQEVVEVTLHVTRDGHAVCLSDRNLVYRTGVNVNVDQITLSTLRHFLPEEQVPTFNELSRLSAGRISLVAVAGTIPKHLHGSFERSIAISYFRHNLSDLTLKGGKPFRADSVKTVAVLASDAEASFQW